MTQQQIDDFSNNYSGCTEILGNVTIEGNTPYAITSLSGLSQLTSISGNLLIAYNDGLTSLSGLNQLSTIGGYLHIYDTGVTELTALNTLNSLGRSLLIHDNDALTSLEGLDNITQILGSLTISKNDILSNIEGIGNIFYGITDLRIFLNPLLSTCSLPRICNYITNGGVNTISNNNVGCSSSAEIASTCLTTNPCTKSLLIINFQPIQTGVYQAIDEVYSLGHVPANHSVEFKAAQCITLDGGFSVQKNAVFSAEIANCGL